MSSIGKILTVFQLGLSLVFLAMAGAVFTAHTNWRDKFDARSKELTSKDNQLKKAEADLKKERDDATKLVNDSKQRADSFEAQNKSLTTELANAKSRLAEIEQEANRQTGLAQAKANEADYREQETQIRRVENDKLQRMVEDLTKTIKALEDELFTLQTQQTDTSKKFADLQKANTIANRILRINQERFRFSMDPRDYEGEIEPAPGVDGVIAETREDETNRVRYVTISNGSDDGLDLKHTLDVYRSGDRTGGKTQYLGKIRIVDVGPDWAVGEVIEYSKTGSIQKGDNVSSRL